MRLREVAWCAVLASGCAPNPSIQVHESAARLAQDQERQERAHVAAFARVEDEVMGWLAAADPRLAARADASAPEALLARIGTEAVLAEDVGATIRGGSLDLFAFRARGRALDEAAKLLASFQDPLPENAPLGSTLGRPALERELLERIIEEELARTREEAMLGDASGDLVRAIVSTWSPPTAPQDWPERDAWVSRHLLEMRGTLRAARPLTGPLDLDVALYPLERLLAPLQFPRGAAAIAALRMALDEDTRSVPPIDAWFRVARAAKVHLGVSLDPSTLRPRLERLEQRLRNRVSTLLAKSEGRADIEARARELLLIERPCPAVPDTRVRSMAPPPERGAICGALRALAEEASSTPALVALHDDVLISLAAFVTTPPPSTGLLSHPEDEDVKALRRTARERPVLALGVALAADLIYGSDDSDERLNAWRAFGEAPLDIVARELDRAGQRPSSAPQP